MAYGVARLNVAKQTLQVKTEAPGEALNNSSAGGDGPVVENVA